VRHALVPYVRRIVGLDFMYFKVPNNRQDNIQVSLCYLAAILLWVNVLL
jgi:hypothetical protein